MNKLLKYSKPMIFILLYCLLFSPMFAQQSMNEYMQGKIDGERSAKGDPLWFLGGFCLSGTGVLAAYIIKPAPPGIALLGKSTEYIMGYTEGYQDKARKQNAKYACAGFSSFLVIYVIYILLLLSSDTSTY